MRDRLIWIATGAGLSAIVALLFQFFGQTTPEGELWVSVGLEPQNQEKAIEAVGDCVGDFEVEMPADAFFIVVKLDRLEASDFICIIHALEPVRHDLSIRSS